MSIIDFLRSKYFWINLVAAVAVVLLLVQGAMWYLKAYTHHGETITVPDLRGLTIDEVSTLLQNRRLDYFIMDSSYVVGKPPLTVLDQDPPPLSKVKENRKVYVTVNSTVPPKVKMPSLVNKNLRVVTPILESLGLQVGELIYRPDLGLNVVLEQRYNGREIEPGTLVPKGSKIDLVLGNGLGDTTVDVPNLIGRTLEEAKWVLTSSNLNLGFVKWDNTITDSSTAVVYRQLPEYDPAAPQRLNYGEPVDIFLTQNLPEYLKQYTADTMFTEP
ncbi:MAG: hypothetical protein KatS3mg031_0413 [Chitinophagales bacterium]|nr:MAG: hypothetical protein KatS3mg031_0413 [Chitinophagales bacterium]